MKKKIAFLSGTRADYGKLKSLIQSINECSEFEAHILLTGMHLVEKYGFTASQVIQDQICKIHMFSNQTNNSTMEETLARTIQELANILSRETFDLIVVHGDRVEALAGAIVGALRNLPVAHIEGGEVSGTIDGLIRHSISKMSHLHFVANESASRRLRQLGEDDRYIFEIGSPDVDVLLSETLPTISDVRTRYEIPFSEYAILIFHPVTTELHDLERQSHEVVKAMKISGKNLVVVMPNNDNGSEIIQRHLAELSNPHLFRHLPSMRFEYFLSLLKHAQMLIGNSSAGIREAPYFGVPSVNIGSRQKGRAKNNLIISVEVSARKILEGMNQAENALRIPQRQFGDGQSSTKFKEILLNHLVWPISIEKSFVDRTLEE